MTEYSRKLLGQIGIAEMLWVCFGLINLLNLPERSGNILPLRKLGVGVGEGQGTTLAVAQIRGRDQGGAGHPCLPTKGPVAPSFPLHQSSNKVVSVSLRQVYLCVRETETHTHEHTLLFLHVCGGVNRLSGKIPIGVIFSTRKLSNVTQKSKHEGTCLPGMKAHSLFLTHLFVCGIHCLAWCARDATRSGLVGSVGMYKCSRWAWPRSPYCLPFPLTWSPKS